MALSAKDIIERLSSCSSELDEESKQEARLGDGRQPDETQTVKKPRSGKPTGEFGDNSDRDSGSDGSVGSSDEPLSDEDQIGGNDEHLSEEDQSRGSDEHLRDEDQGRGTDEHLSDENRPGGYLSELSDRSSQSSQSDQSAECDSYDDVEKKTTA